MTIFCITGFSNASTELTERALLACGMSPHLPLERDPRLDLVRWHERVTNTQPTSGQADTESADRAKQPSRLWQQLAIDLMVANMNSTHWGWAHPGAVQWLEFWSQLESDIRFVLVCEDRQSLVCRLVDQGENPKSMHGHLTLWAQSHQEMLRFHLRNPDKSILVWGADVQTQPSKLVQQIELNWHTPLDATLVSAQAFEHPTSLLQNIALQILSEQPQTASMDHELQALIGPSSNHTVSKQIETADLVELYGQLKERSVLQAQVQQAHEELSAAQNVALAKNKDSQEALELVSAQLQQAKQELEKLTLAKQEAQEKTKEETVAKQGALDLLATEQKNSANLKKANDELSAAQQVDVTKNKDLQEESDLLLAQLHQVQEELAKYYLLNQETREKIKFETAAKQDALDKLTAEQKASAALKKQKDEQSAAHQAALAKNKDLQEESDLLLAQLHQVQEELQKYYLLNQETREKIKLETAAKQDALDKLTAEQKASAALKKQKDEHSAANQAALAKNKDLQEALAKQVVLTQETQEKIKLETAAKQDALDKLTAEQKASAALKKQKDEQSAAHQAALAKNKDLQEESDLLLAQLHQVQEELEKYYLQHKERQIEVQKLQDRWLRAVQNHPELQDFEVLELLSESSTDLTAHWRINQLLIDDVMKGPFEFKTLIENGVTGLVFSKDAKGHSPIHRWPLIAAKENQLTIIPIQGQDDPKKRSATILQLGSTDWHLIELLTDKLVKVVGSASMTKQISHGPALLEGLKAQRQILEKVPPLLRFDDIRLIGQQNTELKSVIGLRLTHADLQGMKANLFEFQLQLNQASGSAMTSAHFVFDEKTTGAPFENWTSNVKSSAGKAVMALQLGPKGWSPELWHTLSPQDQQWLQNTVQLLSFMLATLQNQGVKLEKGWANWANAVAELVNWSKLSVASPEPTITTKSAIPAKLQPPTTAPILPKAPRKPQPVEEKPAKPSVKSQAAKPAAAAKVAAKVTGKPKQAKAQPAKPAATAKVAAKTIRQSGQRSAVAPQVKRRAA